MDNQDKTNTTIKDSNTESNRDLNIDSKDNSRENTLKGTDNNPKPEIIFNYRVLKSSIFFTLVWVGIAIASVYMIVKLKATIKDISGFTLVIAVIYSSISAVQSFDRYGGKYISVYTDMMIIHYSLLHNQKVPFNSIKTMTVENENVGFTTTSGKVNIPLAHLSFDDQKEFLDVLDGKLSKDTF